MRIIGYYNPSQEYPAPVVPVTLSRGSLFAIYRTNGKSERISLSSRVDITFADIPGLRSLSNSEFLFAWSKKEIVKVSFNQIDAILEDERFFAMNPFIALSLLKGVQNTFLISKTLRCCLCEFEVIDEFVASWLRDEEAIQAASGKRVDVRLNEDTFVMDVACDSSVARRIRSAIRLFNGSGILTDDLRLIQIRLQSDPASENHRYSELGGWDLAIRPRISGAGGTPARDALEGTNELFFARDSLALVLSDRLYLELEKPKDWLEFVKALFRRSTPPRWIRQREITPVGTITSLALYEALAAISQSAEASFDSLEGCATYAPDDQSALRMAVMDGEWQVEFLIVQTHAAQYFLNHIEVATEARILTWQTDSAFLGLKLVPGAEIEPEILDKVSSFLNSDVCQGVLVSEGLGRTPGQQLLNKQEFAVGAMRRFQGRPISLTLALDTSGSMRGQKLEMAKRTTLECVGYLQSGRKDRGSFLAFASTAKTLIPLTSFGEFSLELRNQLLHLSAGGGTAICEAILSAVNELKKESEAIRLIILLTDGQENAAPEIRKKVAEELLLEKVRLLAIAYGDDADFSLLEEITNASGGTVVRGNPENLGAILTHFVTLF